MKNLSLAILTVAVLMAAASSCAQRETEDVSRLEQLAFDAWMQKYVIDKGEDAVQQSNGMYIQVLEEGDQTLETTSSDTIVWLRLDYTATDLAHNVFSTRNENVAIRQATFTPHTFYTPDYIFCGSGNRSMIEGQYFALRNRIKTADGEMKLSNGSKVVLYLTSKLAFGSNGFSDDQGYGGQYSLVGSKPIIDTLTVVEVVTNPMEREEKLVESLARDDWGLAEADTLETRFFYIDSLFSRQPSHLEKLETLFANESEWDETQLITADSTARIWFIGRFLPNARYPEGFIFDTNISSVYNEFFNRNPRYEANTKTLSVMSFHPTNDESKYISAFHKAIPNRIRGHWYRFVFTSPYGYGITGQSATLKDQQAYYDEYISYMYNSMYYGGGYGSYGGYGDYYGSYYDNYYYGNNYNYYNYPTSSSGEEDDSIVTEIQPYTPLIFEIYMEPREDE